MANKSKKTEQATESKMGQNFVIIWILVLSGLGIVFVPPTMLVLIAGMIPSFVALLLPNDRPGGPAAMMAFNLAGVIPVIGILWERGQTFHEAFKILSDVYMWLAMLSGAGLAVFLAWGVPIVVFAVYEMQAKATLGRLQKQRAKLIEEWGGQFVTDVKDLEQEQS